MFSEAILPPDHRCTDSRPIDRLNALPFAPAQLAGALEALAMLPAHVQQDLRAQALVLQAYATDTALGEEATISAALHARVAALAKWTAAHDPGRQSTPEAVVAAAAQFPLSERADGIGFEAAGFQEMILFIEELPW